MVNMGDSFTKFPNIVLEALINTKLSDIQHRTFLYIVRWTIGYRNMSRRLLSVAQMAKDMGYDKTGYSRQHIKDAVRDLEQMGMIRVTRRGRGAKAEFEVLSPDYWDKPAHICGHVKDDKHAPISGQEHAPLDGQVDTLKEGQVTCPDLRAQHAPLDGQEHAPLDGHHKRNKEIRKESKRKENPADQEEGEPWDEEGWMS